MKKQLFIYVICSIAIFLVSFFISLNPTLDPILLPPKKIKDTTKTFSLDSLLSHSNSKTIEENISISAYLEGIDIFNIKILKSNISKLLQLKNTDTIGVYKFFTKSIYQIYLKKNILKSFQPQELLARVNFAEKLKTISETDSESSLYMSPISDMYFQSVVEDLERFQAEKTDLVNNFDYQYLVQRCLENQYLPNRKEKNLDKLVKTYIESDYFHLINTTFNKTSFPQKIFIFVFASIWINGLYFSTKLLINLFKKNAS